jgi:hypothetical protein
VSVNVQTLLLCIIPWLVEMGAFDWKVFAFLCIMDIDYQTTHYQAIGGILP